jgi:uncharacterized membrane protein YhhN
MQDSRLSFGIAIFIGIILFMAEKALLGSAGADL